MPPSYGIPGLTRPWNPRSRKARDLGHPRFPLSTIGRTRGCTRARDVGHPPMLRKFINHVYPVRLQV